MNKPFICFIILHYNELEETNKCISSIERMDCQNQIGIVIVDNHSPNGTGLVIQEKYKEQTDVEVVLNDYNMGFSRANNKGCQIAKEKWNPDFYVVANNDIVFTQENFVNLITKEYAENTFAVLGPDIYNTRNKCHQSPISMPSSIKAVNKTILLNKLVLSLYPIVYPLMKSWFSNISKNDGTSFDYTSKHIGKCLMGACLIFSKDYMEQRDKPFSPETNFYYEEFLIMIWCERNNAKVIYQPEIRVEHNEGRATDNISKKEKEKMKFRMKNIYASAKIFRDEWEK